ncbi:MAG: PQQ-dependent sugar dehydrogenase [Chloroflexota bacterium]
MWNARYCIRGIFAITTAILAIGCGATVGVEQPRVEPTAVPSTVAPHALAVEPAVYLDGLMLPVSLQFAQDGRLFFVEVNKGQVRLAEGGVLRPEPVATLDVAKGAEQGLVGLVLHPRFSENGWLYLYYAVPNRNGKIDFNRVVRMTERGGVATDPITIVDKIPADVKGSHNGGRMRFGADGKLFIGTGQAGDEPSGEPKLAGLQGKMLRINDDGTSPTDNPFPGTPVFAMGLRNPFGFDFHPVTGALYGVDNGPKGYDELNLIKPGGNYGWPGVIGAPSDPRYADPIWNSGPERLGMSGFMFYRGDQFPEYRGDAFQCLWNAGSLRRLRFGGPLGDRAEVVEDLSADCRLDVSNGPDGAIYVAGITKIYRISRT